MEIVAEKIYYRKLRRIEIPLGEDGGKMSVPGKEVFSPAEAAAKLYLQLTKSDKQKEKSTFENENFREMKVGRFCSKLEKSKESWKNVNKSNLKCELPNFKLSNFILGFS